MLIGLVFFFNASPVFAAFNPSISLTFTSSRQGTATGMTIVVDDSKETEITKFTNITVPADIDIAAGTALADGVQIGDGQTQGRFSGTRETVLTFKIYNITADLGRNKAHWRIVYDAPSETVLDFIVNGSAASGHTIVQQTTSSIEPVSDTKTTGNIFATVNRVNMITLPAKTGDYDLSFETTGYRDTTSSKTARVIVIR